MNGGTFEGMDGKDEVGWLKAGIFSGGAAPDKVNKMGEAGTPGGTFHGGGSGADEVGVYLSGVCTGVEKGAFCPTS